MTALLSSISNKPSFTLIKSSIQEYILLRNEDKGAKDILLVCGGNVMIKNIVSNFIIYLAYFYFIHDCCDSLALIDLKEFFNADARCDFENICVDGI